MNVSLIYFGLASLTTIILMLYQEPIMNSPACKKVLENHSADKQNLMIVMALFLLGLMFPVVVFFIVSKRIRSLFGKKTGGSENE